MPDEVFEPLPHAPIDEAVVDFRVGFSDEESLGRIDRFVASLTERFPERRVLRAFEGRIHLQEEEPYIEKQAGSTLGFMVRSDDGRRFLQAKTTGMTFGNLKPYASWDELFGEGWELWQGYRAAAGPESVTRIATRFINRLKLPLEFETEEYFTTPIAVPEGVPDHLESFNYDYLVNAGQDMFAKVRLASEPLAEGSEQSSVLLDIDCYLVRVRPADDGAITDDMVKLRALKNRIFFSTLTETAKELFR